MDCLKSQNQFVNAAMFPGGFAKSSYSTSTIPPSKTSSLRLIYIPFTPNCLNGNYIASSPTYIPAILVIGRNNQASMCCIHFHGNACDIAQIKICAERESYCFNAHYLLVEYPRFGISDGYPCEVTLDEVSKSVYDFVINNLRVPHSRVVLLGRSIGTGPVCSLASYLQSSERPVAAVILQSPYTSIRDAASDLLGCTSNLMLDRWQNWVHLVGNGNSSDVVIKSPVLFLHADNDKIINCNHSRLLHQYRTMLKLPSELFIQASTDTFVKGHNYFDYEKDVLQPSKSFLSRQVPAASSLIALPLEVVDAVTQIPVLFRQLGQRELQSKAPVASSKIDRDASLIASSSRSSLNSSSSSSSSLREDSIADEYTGLSNKCSDKCALAGWAVCCCIFCGECWLSLGYRAASKAYYTSLGRRPFFDYQLLKPQDNDNGKSGSILLLFDKSAIVENPTAPPTAVAAAAAAKTKAGSENERKKSVTTEIRSVNSDVRNPLQSQNTASSKSTSTDPSSEKQEGPKTVYFLPG